MPEIPKDLQAILGLLLTALTTWYATRSANSIKARELAKTEQGEFLKTVMAEMEGLKEENKTIRQELDAVRDEVRGLRSEKTLLERNNAEQLRVLGRVAACTLQGCPHAARAAEFGGGA